MGRKRWFGLSAPAGWLVLVWLAISLGACGASGPGKGPVAGDSLYVPEGYRAKLEAAGLQEIEDFPYFTAPFIAVVKDAGGREAAALFDRTGAFRTVPLPVAYEQIVQAMQKRGIPIPTPLHATQPSAAFRNLHLFEIGSALFWNYDDGTTRLYLDLEGREADPFAKTGNGGAAA